MSNGIVSGGTPKLTTDSTEADYQQFKRAAIEQSGENPYIQGVQSGFEASEGAAQQLRDTYQEGVDEVLSKGPGQAISDSRTEYGDTRLKTNTVLQGERSNFATKDSPTNQPLADTLNTTGNVANHTASTFEPEKDPEVIEEDALQKRLALYSGKMGGADMGHNDRSNTLRT